MYTVASSYIHTAWTQFRDEAPPPVTDPNIIIASSYNVLYPLDISREWGPKFNAWLRSRLDGGNDPFPLSDEVLGAFPSSLYDNGASRQVEIYFAKIIQEQLKQGNVISLELALEKAKAVIEPVYQAIVDELKLKKFSARGGMIERYNKLINSFNEASNVEKTVAWMLIEISETDNLEKKVVDFIQVGSPSNYRNMEHLYRPEMDSWKFRKKAVIQTLSSIQKYANGAPHFFSLQEVTPPIFEDLKKAFPTTQWYSFNNLTGRPTQLISAEDETVQGEGTSLTVTIGLSQAWKVEKVMLDWLSETPNQPSHIEGGSGVIRTILGIVAIHPLTSKKIVIINTHSDHFSMKKEVRKVTPLAINQFIDKVTENRTLPFIISGDLNVFENCDGQNYYEALKGDKGDYRDQTLYAPKEIQKSTFLGLPADAYNAKIDEAGNVEPNALDHIFYSLGSLQLQYAIRDAGVFNEAGEIINPDNRAEYIDALKKRQTASDHFANIAVFKV